MVFPSREKVGLFLIPKRVLGHKLLIAFWEHIQVRMALEVTWHMIFRDMAGFTTRRSRDLA